MLWNFFFAKQDYHALHHYLFFYQLQLAETKVDSSPGLVDIFPKDPKINSPDFIKINGYLNTNAFISESVNDYTYRTAQAVQYSYSILDDLIVGAQEYWADIFAIMLTKT